MGYHYFRADRFDDVTINELKPEALMADTRCACLTNNP